MEKPSNITVTVKFAVKTKKLNEFFKSISNLESDTFDMYWVESVNWPVDVVTESVVVDPIRNVTGY